MKKLFKNMGRVGLMCLMVVALAFLVVVPVVNAQVDALSYSNSMSSTSLQLLTSTNVANGSAIDVWQNRGMSFAVDMKGGQSTNTGLTAFFYALSQDGTTYSSTTPLIIYATANGTTRVVNTTNVPASFLDNVKKIKLITITNALANQPDLVITNVVTAKRY
jgi:hypothetical protein